MSNILHPSKNTDNFTRLTKYPKTQYAQLNDAETSGTTTSQIVHIPEDVVIGPNDVEIEADGNETVLKTHQEQENDSLNLLYHVGSIEDEVLASDWYFTNSKVDVVRQLQKYNLIGYDPKKRLFMEKDVINRNSNQKCICSQRGSPLIIYNNQLYRPHEMTKSGSIMARCTFSLEGSDLDSGSCKGKIHVDKDTGTVQIHQGCQHGSRRSHIAYELILRKIAIIILQTDVSKERLFRIASEDAEKFDITYLIRSNKTMSRKLDGMLGRKSSNAFPPSLDPNYFQGARCCLDSSGNFRTDEEILIIWRVNGLDPYFDTNSIHLDGSFSGKPRHYRQLYAITARDTRSQFDIPFLFALCNSSKIEMYTRIYHCAYLEGIDPEFIYCDFEMGEITAAGRIWPNATIFGCLYHWKIAILCKLEFIIGYDEVRQVVYQRILRSVYCLAFADETHYFVYFKELKQRVLPIHNQMDVFFSYLERTYFGVRPRYRFGLWNCRYRAEHGIDFTNNSSERMFSAYKRLFNHNDYLQIRTSIRKTIEFTENILRDVRSGRNVSVDQRGEVPLYKNPNFLRAVIYRHPNFDSFMEKVFPWMLIPKKFH